MIVNPYLAYQNPLSIDLPVSIYPLICPKAFLSHRFSKLITISSHSPIVYYYLYLIIDVYYPFKPNSNYSSIILFSFTSTKHFKYYYSKSNLNSLFVIFRLKSPFSFYHDHFKAFHNHFLVFCILSPCLLVYPEHL